jgi:hypothetical protein
MRAFDFKVVWKLEVNSESYWVKLNFVRIVPITYNPVLNVKFETKFIA